LIFGFNLYTQTAHSSEPPCPDMKSWETESPKTQFQLGEAYFGGWCQIINYPKAEKWYLKAATAGNGKAQLRLGFLYAEKHFTGVKTDLDAAEKWFLKAAKQNVGDAQFRLGNFYLHYTKPAKIDLAEKWLLKAANNNHITAQYDLGLLYQNEAYKKLYDIKKSISWLTKAAGNSHYHAMISLAQYYQKNGGLDVPLEQSWVYWAERLIMEHKSTPLYWYHHVADFYKNNGVPEKAKDYYQMAHDKGSEYAAKQLVELSP